MAVNSIQEREEVNKDLDRLADELEKLRLSFEQYFLGLEKREPTKLRESVVSLLRKTSGTSIQNARSRFRLQQTVARYNTYSTYWDRVLKEIEEGTYKRDIFKAKLHEKARGVAQKPDTSKSRPDPVTDLFSQYIAARKKCNEPTANLTLEGFTKSLQTQLDLIYKKTGSKNVKFKVVAEGGKTKIKAMATSSKQ